MKRRLVVTVLAILATLGLATPAIAGGSGDFYYQRYSSYVCGFRISVSNYDNSTGGQTYHFAFQSLDSGWTPAYWRINNGSIVYRNYYAGYQNYSTKSTDHSWTGYAQNASGGLCYATIPASAFN